MKKRLLFLVFLVSLSMVIGILSHAKRPDTLLNNENIDARKISFFTENHQPLLECQVEDSIDSEIIVEVESTGHYEYVKQNLIQEVKIVSKIKGDCSIPKNEIAYVIGNGWDEGNGMVSTGFVNYMQQKNHYILFAEKIFYDEKYGSNIILLNEFLSCMRYINISNDRSVAYETNEPAVVYGKVKDSEFFSNDKTTLQMMIDTKYKILEELNSRYCK